MSPDFAFILTLALRMAVTAAFGLGLGAYMSSIEWRGREISYLSFVAPGMLAYAAFMTPFFQALYASFIRMHYQRTWEGQLTTQIEMRHVVWGELLWAAVLGTVYAAIVSIVLALRHRLVLHGDRADHRSPEPAGLPHRAPARLRLGDVLSLTPPGASGDRDAESALSPRRRVAWAPAR